MKYGKTLIGAVLGAALLGGSSGVDAQANDPIAVGHLATNTGETASVASVYGQGVADAMTWLNEQGGISGRPLNFETVDYAYDALQAVSTYAEWRNTLEPVAIQGWGTADTEALVDFVARDQTVFFSGSSSGHLTDPTGRSDRADKPAPYNFFYGPSYSDGCRGLVQWAAEDWRRTGGAGRSVFLQDLTAPTFVHMGDNHPYPSAPQAACADYAEELGFEVLQPIRYSLRPGDFSAQCRALRQVDADYAFLANTADSNVELVRDCANLGVRTQFLTNIYGWDEFAAEAAGESGNGLVWVVTASHWNADVPGMERVREISRMSDPSGETYRPVHYMRGICSVAFMADAMELAASAGGVTGPRVKAALESFQEHVPEGLEGVCLPSTWTADDHRGTTEVVLYESTFSFGQSVMEPIYRTKLPLRPDWLGW